jgi:hypothetical protein
MKPSVQSLTPEQKRAMLARLLKQQPAVCKTAFILQGLILDCMMNQAPVWNMRSTIRFFNQVDPELLRSRMQKVIDRHPALRTTYEIPKDQELEYHAKILMIRLESLRLCDVNLDTQVLQRVHAGHSLDFTVVDAKDWTAEQLRQRLLDDAMQPYDISQLPVCRLRIYQRNRETLMQFDVHHCAADLWSLELIMAELEQPPVGPPPPSFAEFCSWQHSWFALPKASEMRDWWVSYLEGCPNLALPHSEGDDIVDFVLFRFDSELLALARQACRAHRITLFNLVLSTLQVTMGRALGLQDFAIGGAVANRPNQRFEDTVGFFAQLVLYRRDLQEIESWEQLWAKNRGTISEVLDRQFYPVVTTLPVPRTDVWIMFQQYQKARWIEENVPQGEPLGLRTGGVVESPFGPWEFLFVEPPYNSSPVMLEIIEQKDGCQGAFRFRTTCMSRRKAEFYAQDFQRRFRSSLIDPGASIDIGEAREVSQ